MHRPGRRHRLRHQLDPPARRADGRSHAPLERLMRITRLGQGVDRTGRLDPAAIERTVAVLREYREVMDRFGVDAGAHDGHVGGARRRQPRRVLRRGRGRRSGVRPELLSGRRGGPAVVPRRHRRARPRRRARSSSSTSAAAPPSSRRHHRGRGRRSRSTSAASASPRRSSTSDPPTAEELSQALSVVEVHLDDVAPGDPATLDDAATFVGLAGTVTPSPRSSSAWPLRPRPHPPLRLTKAAAEDVFRTLATETAGRPVHNPGLEPERADVIVGGLLRPRRRSCAASTSTSAWCREADILDGLAMSLAAGRLTSTLTPVLGRPPAPVTGGIARIAGREHPVRPPRAAAPARASRLPAVERGPAPQRGVAHQVGARAHPGHARRRSRTARRSRCAAAPASASASWAPATASASSSTASFAGEINLYSVQRGPFQNAYVGYWIDEAKAGQQLHARGASWCSPASPSRSCGCTASRSPSSPATGPAAG